jgi:hypothetical protein
MDEKSVLTITYTKRANQNALGIKGYLLYHFTQTEVDNFYNLLAAFEKVVIEFPLLYPKSTKNKTTHRAVLSKQLSVF